MKFGELDNIRSFDLHGFEIRNLFSGGSCLVYRPILQSNSLVDGSVASDDLWDSLRISEAWSDGGPSPAGNIGPYLQVPRHESGDRYVHRVYPKYFNCDICWVKEKFHTIGDEIIYDADRMILSPSDVKLFRDGGTNFRFFDVMNEIRFWTRSSRMVKSRSRLNIRIMNVGLQRMKSAPAFSDGYRFVEFSYPKSPKPGIFSTSELPKKVHSIVWKKLYPNHLISSGPWVLPFIF